MNFYKPATSGPDKRVMRILVIITGVVVGVIIALIFYSASPGL